MKVSKIKSGMLKMLPAVEDGSADLNKVVKALVKSNVALCDHIEWLEGQAKGANSRIANIERKSESPIGSAFSDIFGGKNL